MVMVALLVVFHVPVPGVALFPASVVDVVEEQSCWSGPALETTEAFTVITTVSFEIQAPFVIVQTKEYVPAVVKPVIVDVGFAGAVIVAILVVVHKPLPLDGVFPFNEVVPVLAQICWSAPALDGTKLLTVILIVSREVQVPFTIVQTKS